MENCKAISFIRLADYGPFNKTSQILLTEAVRMIFSGTLNHTPFQTISNRELPTIIWNQGLNRNPLAEDTSELFGINSTLYRSQRALEAGNEIYLYVVLATNSLLLRHIVEPNGFHPLGVVVVRRIATHKHSSNVIRHRSAQVLEVGSRQHGTLSQFRGWERSGGSHVRV